MDGGALVLNGPRAPADLARLPRPTALTTARRLAYRALPTLETGLVINVPSFVNEGDKVRVSTETGEYQSRV